MKMLVTCPECEAKISEKADPCPKCGLPSAGERSREAAEREAQFMRGLNFFIGAHIICENQRCNFRGHVDGPFTVEVIQGGAHAGYKSVLVCRCPKCGRRVTSI